MNRRRPPGRRRLRPAVRLGIVSAALAVIGPGAAGLREPVARAGSTCFGEPITIIGSQDADVIRGTDGPDVIDGEGGDDVIDGLGGDDLICGSGGDDTIHGGAGRDRCDGGSGHDMANSCEATQSVP